MDCRQKAGYGKIETDGTIRHEAGQKVHSMDVLHQEKTGGDLPWQFM